MIRARQGRKQGIPSILSEMTDLLVLKDLKGYALLFVLLLFIGVGLGSGCTKAEGSELNDAHSAWVSEGSPLIKDPKGKKHATSGKASWYGKKFQGRSTASGESFDMHALTAAHRTFPFGTIVKVQRIDGGQFVVVKVNDRGPFTKGRVIDLSRAAAEKIGMIRAGVVKVTVEVVRWGKGRTHHKK